MTIFDDVKSMNLEYLWKHDPRKFTQCVQRLTEQVLETVRPEKRKSLREFHTRVGEILLSCNNDTMVRQKMMELLKDSATAQLEALSRVRTILLQTESGTPKHGPEPQKNEK